MYAKALNANSLSLEGQIPSMKNPKNYPMLIFPYCTVLGDPTSYHNKQSLLSINAPAQNQDFS